MQKEEPAGIRPVDIVMTVVLLGLSTTLIVSDIVDRDATVQTDHRTWSMLPVFVLAVVPVLWWRRSVVIAASASAVVMALHDLAFDTTTRCGAGLPLAFVFGFLAGVHDGWRRSLPALVAAEALTAAVLWRDAAAGPGLIPVASLLTAGTWVVGQIARQRIALARQLRARNEELAQLRDARAAADVGTDRARLSADLDALLDERLDHLAKAATTPTGGDADKTGLLLATIEADSRRVLEQMREIVGALRGGEVALAPAPSVAHLEALLSRRSQADTRLAVQGDPRTLPASVELSAYRVVEHLLGVLTDDPDTRVDVTMRFTDTALEITVSGTVHRGADVHAAVARARERVRLQHGTLTVKIGRSKAQVMAHLPVAPV